MTTYFQEIHKCGNCGAEVELTVIGSTNAFGTCDLDLRPPPLKRFILPEVIQFCEKCGYVSYDISEKPEGGNQDELKKCLARPLNRKNYAQLYQRAAEIQQIIGTEHDQSVQLFIRAAWCADDAHDVSNAEEMRKKAVSEFLLVKEDFTEDYLLQMVDVARRAGDKSNAFQFIKLLKKMPLESLYQQILDFQEALLEKDDRKCYTVSDVSPQ